MLSPLERAAARAAMMAAVGGAPRFLVGPTPTLLRAPDEVVEGASDSRGKVKGREGAGAVAMDANASAASVVLAARDWPRVRPSVGTTVLVSICTSSAVDMRPGPRPRTGWGGGVGIDVRRPVDDPIESTSESGPRSSASVGSGALRWRAAFAERLAEGEADEAAAGLGTAEG
jgi:hypothetical protein